eukprot:6175393-Pleurochrysis_carterae.AAC.1
MLGARRAKRARLACVELCGRQDVWDAFAVGGDGGEDAAGRLRLRAWVWMARVLTRLEREAGEEGRQVGDVLTGARADLEDGARG